MIILEGPDGAGKTSLLEVITHKWHGAPPDNYNVQVTHSPGPLPKDLYYHAMKILRDAKPVCILDRFPYFSESVYGKVLRPYPLMNTHEFIALRERLLKMRPLVIYCRPPLTMLKETHTVKEQMHGVEEHYNELVDGYDKAYASWIRDFRIATYDFTQGAEAMTRIGYVIRAYIEEEQRGEWM